jgi:hypothetical protein
MRVASIVRRSIERDRVDAADRRDLRMAREALLSGVAATRSEDAVRPRALTRQLTSMGLMYAAAKTGRGRQDEMSLTGSLEALAADLRRLERQEKLEDPEALLSYYQRLAARARRQSSSAGERVIRTAG